MLVERTERVVERADGIRLELLGPFDIVDRGMAATIPVPAQRLAAFLAVRDEPVGRPRASGMLWPEVEQNHALSNLRTALWRLRTLHPGLVRTLGTTLTLAPDVTIDLRESERLAHRILHEPLPLGEARHAADHLSHDLLPDWEDEWLVFERERFRDLRVRALERLCTQLSELGAHAEAAQAGLLAVQADPLRESSYIALMEAYTAEGNEACALQLYRALESRLDRELQVAPSPATADLARKLLGLTGLEAAPLVRPVNASG
jgi:DNA-binding SARP family transcriptional activator